MHGKKSPSVPNAACKVSLIPSTAATASRDNRETGALLPKPILALSVMLLLLISPIARAADTEKLLYQFRGGVNDGALPLASLVRDKAGNFYGTTMSGGIGPCVYNGIPGCGTVFQLSRSGNSWKETVLHKFTRGSDGATPFGALVLDGAGNLYGTATAGGASGNGVVFQLSPTQGGAWIETEVHTFAGGTDGSFPASTLIFDKAGNLYGTTAFGGGSTVCESNGCGTVYELAKSNGNWIETVLNRFDGSNGQSPEYSSLTFDQAGDLYGADPFGGTTGWGVVFELQNSKGNWAENVLYTFTDSNTDGAIPIGALLRDQSGNLYGTAGSGEGPACGDVFELKQSTGLTGAYGFRLLHAFSGSDGCEPFAGLTYDSQNGKIYGTTFGGGKYDSGTLFVLTPNSGGEWSETVENSFGISGTDGYAIVAGVILDGSGNLYGTGEFGGADGLGVVYEIESQ